ncbi:MAG: hypothetical protein M1503_02915 [Thaumarchaeota archaeon]|nr:hypothetical protein [Nitrososphaerota archaeon]
MSEDESNVLGYTKEKLYDLLPAVYRQKDAKLSKPLEDLISIIAAQAAALEKNIGGLYDNWFIETCDEWVTSYIADLMGVKTLSASKSSSSGSLSTTEVVSQRAYVANTISYRRRKGTVSMLEQLAGDVSQWKAKAVEFFQLLSTTQNVNHIRLTNHGTPDLRNTSSLDLIDTPFDTVAHTLEVRHINSGRGYYNIPNIGIFLWRLQALPSIDTHAFKKSEKAFTFNPLGYDDISIFNLPITEDLPSHLAEEVNVPAPIRRRALYDNFEKYYSKDRSILLTVKYVNETKWQEIAPRDIVVCNLSDWHTPDDDKIAIDPELGRIAFSKEAEDVKVNYYYGSSGKIGGGFYTRPEYDSDFQAEPTLYRVSTKQVFAWNKVPGDSAETSHLKEMLRNDIPRYLSEEKQINVSLDWVTENLSFNKEGDDRTITMTDGTHSLSIALGTGDESATFRVNGVAVYEFPARKTEEGDIYVSINIDVYGSVNEAIVWWKKNRSQNAVFEIIDSEVYTKNIEVNLPANFTLAIKADQGKRPLLRALRIQGEKGSRLILDGLWFNNPTSTPAIKIQPGDLESLTIRHCTLVPGRNTLNNKVSLGNKSYIRRQLCVWSDIKTDTSNKHSRSLADFLNRELNLGWVNEDAVFQKVTDPNGECITLTAGSDSLRIDLEDAEAAETSAFLSVKDEQEVWKKVYEFTVLTENGKKVMYLAGGNDDLEVTLNRTISGRINILDSLLFTWERISSCRKRRRTTSVSSETS